MKVSLLFIIFYFCSLSLTFPQNIPGQNHLLRLPGNRVAKSGFYRPLTAVCDNTNKHVYSYDTSGNCVSVTDQVWSGSGWVNSSRFNYTFGKNNKCIYEYDEGWINDSWVGQYRFTFNYDNPGYCNELCELISNGVWISYSRLTLALDINGNCLSQIIEQYANNAWVKFTRNTYTYDGSGDCLSNVLANWDSFSSSWINQNRLTDTYNLFGKCLTEYYDIWNGSAWVSDRRTTYTYDNAGNCLNGLLEAWWNLAWQPGKRYTFTNDISGNCLNELIEQMAATWTNTFRYNYNYDYNGNCIHGECFHSESNAWVPFTATDGINVGYNYHTDLIKYYCKTVDVEYTMIAGTGSENTNVHSFSLNQNYPNPFNPATTINYSLEKAGIVNLTVYNSLGSKITNIVNEYKPAGSYSIQFNGSNLASGIYFYRLESGNRYLVKKFILMK